mmetsp:Transcript_53121/g.158300  ORF Transcript_53121/g.158300 Transcript_53121/m.158300 type:complete len:123 (-) Transcript_53121:149-517(-)
MGSRKAAGLRAGWAASQACECEKVEIDPKCGLLPRAPFPFSVVGAKPPLCAIQDQGHFWDRWRKCDPRACRDTRCRIGGPAEGGAAEVAGGHAVEVEGGADDESAPDALARAADAQEKVFQV